LVKIVTTLPQYSFFNPQEVLLKHFYLIISLNAINMKTDSPAGWLEKGRRGQGTQGKAYA